MATTTTPSNTLVTVDGLPVKLPVELAVFRGSDGALVVQIDTITDNPGRLRVNVNNGPVWDCDVETGERFSI